MVAFPAPSPHEETSTDANREPQHAKIDKNTLCDHGKEYQNTRDGEMAACDGLRRWRVLGFWLCRQGSGGVSSLLSRRAEKHTEMQDATGPRRDFTHVVFFSYLRDCISSSSQTHHDIHQIQNGPIEKKKT